MVVDVVSVVQVQALQRQMLCGAILELGRGLQLRWDVVLVLGPGMQLRRDVVLGLGWISGVDWIFDVGAWASMVDGVVQVQVEQ